MGVLRLMLAIVVIGAHTGGSFAAWLPGGGRAAVVIFYMISGFYMALVINTKYVDVTMNRDFWLSRFLRIWPPYAALMMVFLLLAYRWAPSRLVDYTTALSAAPDWLAALSVISNIGILFQDIFWLISFSGNGIEYAPFGVDGHVNNGIRLLLNLPMFTVSFELIFYMVAPFFLRGLRGSYVLALIGFIWLTSLTLAGLNSIDFQYHMFPPALFYFGIGALSWWIANEKTVAFPKYAGVPVGFILLSQGFLNQVAPPFLVGLAFFAIPMLFALTKSSRADRLIGELSYTVYLAHFPIIDILSGLGLRQVAYFSGLVVLIAVIIGFVTFVAIDYPLMRVRSRLGNRRDVETVKLMPATSPPRAEM